MITWRHFGKLEIVAVINNPILRASLQIRKLLTRESLNFQLQINLVIMVHLHSKWYIPTWFDHYSIKTQNKYSIMCCDHMVTLGSQWQAIWKRRQTTKNSVPQQNLLENGRLSDRYRIGTDTGCIVSNRIGYCCIGRYYVHYCRFIRPATTSGIHSTKSS